MSGDYTVGRVAVLDTSASMYSAHETRPTVSTSFMNLMFQFTFPLLGAGAGFGSMPSLFMPSAIGDVGISTRPPNMPSESVRVVAAGRLGRQSPGSASLCIDAWHAACGEPVVIMEDFKMSHVKGGMGADQTPRLPCYNLE
ncbi:Polyketide synthase [Metarhizium humberi]|uniref:Polyketide synthase n=1 Tax=Metarhizium humberi TaxID=2596975 RepID=A0A9P8MMI6_9HYPO|nr:Polyketide synthase [Metarhizium humberi]